MLPDGHFLGQGWGGRRRGEVRLSEARSRGGRVARGPGGRGGPGSRVVARGAVRVRGAGRVFGSVVRRWGPEGGFRGRGGCRADGRAVRGVWWAVFAGAGRPSGARVVRSRGAWRGALGVGRLGRPSGPDVGWGPAPEVARAVGWGVVRGQGPEDRFLRKGASVDRLLGWREAGCRAAARGAGLEGPPSRGPSSASPTAPHGPGGTTPPSGHPFDRGNSHVGPGGQRSRCGR